MFCLERINYCQKWRTILYYKSITFVDEKPFELGKIPNRQNMRRYQYKSTKKTILVIQVEKHSTKYIHFVVLIGRENLIWGYILIMFPRKEELDWNEKI